MSVLTLNAIRPSAPTTETRPARPVAGADIAEPFDDEERLCPARGITNGLLIAVPFWLLVLAGLWFWL
jgi:hypothetical protein